MTEVDLTKNVKEESLPVSKNENIEDVLDVLLEAGSLLHRNGADSSRIEMVVSSLAKSLGCEEMDLFISFNSLVLTIELNGQSKTKIKRIAKHGVNLTVVSGISRISWRVKNKSTSVDYIKEELKRITGLPVYNRWLAVVAAGLACGGFCRNSGGDWISILITIIAASVAMFVRQTLTKKGYNSFLIVVCTALVGSLLASISVIFNLGNDPHIAVACSVLLLVPGVQMINSIQDLISGHTMVGIARGMIGILFSIYIALGLLIAMGITGITL